MAQQFVSTQSTYFDATYGSLSDQQFILALYSNLGGNTTGVTGQDLAYWQGQLDNFGGDRALLAGEFTLEFLNYAGSDPAGLDRQQQLYNKVAVSIDWVATSAESGNEFMNASTPGDAAFEAETRILQGVTSDTSTLDIALDQIAAVDEFDDLALAIGQPLPVGDLRLTIGVDTPTEGFSSGNGGIIEAPDGVFDATPASNPPLGVTNTLNTGDTLIDTAGDGTINYTVATGLAALVNPPFANGVNMDGVATANILNPSVLTAGFAGNINGLQTLNALGGSIGDLQLGVDGAGLNDPLQTINVSASVDVEVFTETSAFDGTNELDLNLNGVDTFVDLDLSGAGTDGYVAINVSSLVGPNFVELDAEEDTVATVNVLGDEDIVFDDGSSALNRDTLNLFDGSLANGRITAFFDEAGDLEVQGGSNDDDFAFSSDPGAISVFANNGDDVITFLTDNGDPTTFGTDDFVDGGTGDNRLRLQADEGVLLATGVGASIMNIQTIEHFTFFGASNALSVDMSESGSANVLDLAGDYSNDDVTVTHLTNAKSVIFTGDEIHDLTLDHDSAVGTVNFTMSQTAEGGTQDIFDDLIVPNGLILEMVSTGNADLNEVDGANEIAANVHLTGDVDLNIGLTDGTYDEDGGIFDAAAFTGQLGIAIGSGSQTVIGGTNDDFINVLSSSAPDLIHLEAGGDDEVQFHTTFENANSAPNNSNYTEILGYSAGDVIQIDVVGGGSIDLDATNGDDVQPNDPVNVFNYVQGSNPDLSALDINFIKFDTAVPGNLTPDNAFDQLMGANHIDVDGTGGSQADLVLMAYYDSANTQMVLFTVEPSSAPNDEITAADDIDVVALVGMSLTDYQAFGAGGLEFVS